MSKYKKENYIKSKINNYYKNKYKNKQIRQNMKNRRIKDRKIDTIHKIYNNLISRIYQIFKKNNLKFNVSYEELLGCNIEKLKNHIINSLKDDMTLSSLAFGKLGSLCSLVKAYNKKRMK